MSIVEKSEKYKEENSHNPTVQKQSPLTFWHISFLGFISYLCVCEREIYICKFICVRPSSIQFSLVCLLAQVCMTLCDPADCMWPTRLLCPWDSPGKNTRVGCPSLIQEILQTQGSNPGLLHCKQILHHRATWEAMSYYYCIINHQQFRV